ncbi:MAG: LysM peptidoglycan-binding domain-containing protein [Ruminococcus sp.]|jgi:spore germination protein|nr:LysM peptidoglycan-binding domain-containing protein [Ruminococcus sp.]
MYIHIVKKGDTLYKIAAQYGVSIGKLSNDNGIRNPDKLAVGQAILIIIPTVVHIVKPGDNLFSISKLYGVTTNTLYMNNPSLVSRDVIFPGEVLTILCSPNKIRSINTLSFAYPNANKDILYHILPYLTRLSVFGYTYNNIGVLNPLDDEEIIADCRKFNVEPVLLVSNIDKSGSFSREQASLVINNPEYSENMSKSGDVVIREKGYRGVDFDFENIAPDDRYPYIEFIKYHADHVHNISDFIHIDLPPKASREDYIAYDYIQLGQIVDCVLIMTYEWGYSKSEPMAVAPINKVREVIKYTTEVILRQKVFMGLPNYGYDWTLPYVKGKTTAKSISNLAATELAAEKNAEIKYDETAQTPYFRYKDERGQTHEVWFEDVRSILKKFELMDEYDLKGVGIWNAMRSFPAMFMMMNYRYRILKTSS